MLKVTVSSCLRSTSKSQLVCEDVWVQEYTLYVHQSSSEVLGTHKLSAGFSALSGWIASFTVIAGLAWDCSNEWHSYGVSSMVSQVTLGMQKKMFKKFSIVCTTQLYYKTRRQVTVCEQCWTYALVLSSHIKNKTIKIKKKMVKVIFIQPMIQLHGSVLWKCQSRGLRFHHSVNAKFKFHLLPFLYKLGRKFKSRVLVECFPQCSENSPPRWLYLWCYVRENKNNGEWFLVKIWKGDVV